MHSTILVGVNDMTDIPEIDELIINNNLKLRYEKDIIYTYTGSILVAVNPYKSLYIFNKDYVFKYRSKKTGFHDPHVFALAEAAYRNIVDDDESQSVVISGESGAGKTETTKFILQYLCAVTSGVSTWIHQQILEANTILEAFGNAKTMRNDNSSRFGKFLQVCFDTKHCIKGCVIQDYLLEQSRITHQSSEERNYHVLYQLVAQGQRNPEMMSEFCLRPATYYRYLNSSSNNVIDIENESKKFEALIMAFTVLQIAEQSIDGVFKVLSSILWLGNLDFCDVDGERCELQDQDKEICRIISKLLGLNYDDITEVLLRRQINVRGNITEIPHKLQEARENRHAMAKALYSKTFAWLVSKINSCTNPGRDGHRFLGVLDIFGFENFSKNSFEQLCINYTNEKLHKFFNHYVFTLEQEIYRQEEIVYSHIEFTDNSMCLELIEKPPRCVFKLLTEQCHMPKGSDNAYLNNMHAEFEFNPYYIKGVDRRHWETEFGIKHYAGCVIYTVEGFVDKNRDVQQVVLFDYMSRSENNFVKNLSYYQELQPNSSTTTQRGTAKVKITVSDNFRQQLQSLLDVLQNTKPWYVRCIKPNVDKLPNKYDDVLVLDQLKYLGMLDIIRIRREGFPIHFTYADFVSKYKSLLRGRKLEITKTVIENIMTALNISNSEWQIGKSKVFLKPKAYEPLEDITKRLVNSKALTIQKNWKCYIQSKHYTRIRNAVLKIQHAYRGWKLRIKFLRMRRAVVVIQSHLRGVYAREVASALREMRRVDEEMRKRLKSLKESVENNESSKALEDCERIVQEEIKALSHMADQINCLRVNNHSPSKKCQDKVDNLNIDCVDLDNLFAFLSDNSRNPILDELSDKIDGLVKDFDLELECAKSPNNTGPKVSLLNAVTSSAETTVPTIQPQPLQLMDDKHDENSYKLSSNKVNFEPIYEAILVEDNSLNPKIKKNQESQIVSSDSKNQEFQNKTVRAQNLRSSVFPKIMAKETNLQDINEREQRRKYRVEKKILELNQNTTDSQKDVYNNDVYYNIIEFAERYFNSHERGAEGTIMATLTRKNKKSCEHVPKCEMITFLRADRIPSSHIHMYDPENVILACNIFSELCKYMRGELQADRELQVMQYIIGLGIEREELRDEIFVQCIRQATNNPNADWTDRLWLMLCLTIVAFQPSKLLFRYFVSFLKTVIEMSDGKLRQYAQWCFDNCKCTKASSRLLPPSSVEVAAMKRLGTIVCRFFFLDGRTKAIDVHPTDTAGDAVLKLAEKLNLSNTEGWAIFQSSPSGEEHIKFFDYLYDVIAAWELKQIKLQTSAITVIRSDGGSSSGENRFVFKKRLFKSTRELSQDPAEISLLYAQAVYSVVKCDDFPVSEKVALQLAGLQAQVALGDPSHQPKPEYYVDVNNFLPERISKTREHEFWIPILAQAHRQYGASRNELTAKVLYLSCVMQYPLYGTTMFNVIYKGFWSHCSNIIFGVNCEGIMFIQPEDKYVLYHFKYSDIESIMLDPSDSFITLTLNRHYIQVSTPTAKCSNMSLEAQRCFVFETTQKNEIGSLIVSYFPPLSNWIMNSYEIPKKFKVITNEDRSRLYQNVVVCRRQLVDMDVLRKPQEFGGGFFKNTLRKLSKHRLEKLRLEQSNSVQEHGETYRGYPHSFWAFSKQQITQSLIKLADQEDIVMIQVFQAILTYSGLGVTGDTVQRAEDEHVTIVQSIMEKCMRKECLINELYLQLIKQTTDHPDPNSRVNLRHWALLSLACSVILPTAKTIRKYLISHLKRCASDYITEEGKYARFAEKCFFKTQGSKRRQWPPSREEIICTVNRRPCYSKFYFMDGQFYSIEFHPSCTALEVTELIKKKIGLHSNCKGYAIYEVVGNTERCLLAEEKIAEVIAKWEKYRNATQQGLLHMPGTTMVNNCRYQHYMFLFKKHLFFDDYVNIDDPVEKELLYHQILHCLRTERFPISEMEAVMLTALQGQLELGDYDEVMKDYRAIASHCLPPRFVPNIPHEAVAMHHQSLHGMLPAEAKKAFLNLIQSWPLHRATIFDVMQTFTSNWPRILWLAVDQNGIHLLEHRSRNILCTHDYELILSYSPNMNSIMIFTGTEKKQSKIILSTSQAFQIATLIKEYSDIVKAKKSVSENSS